MLNTKIHRDLGYPILGRVFGAPGKRHVVCPHCGATVFLPKGPLRDQAFTCDTCYGLFAIDWNAEIKAAE